MHGYSASASGFVSVMFVGVIAMIDDCAICVIQAKLFDSAICLLRLSGPVVS